METAVKKRIVEILSYLSVIQRIVSYSNENAHTKILIASSWLHMIVKDEAMIPSDKLLPIMIPLYEYIGDLVHELGEIRVDPTLRPFTELAMTNLQEALFLMEIVA